MCYTYGVLLFFLMLVFLFIWKWTYRRKGKWMGKHTVWMLIFCRCCFLVDWHKIHLRFRPSSFPFSIWPSTWSPSDAWKRFNLHQFVWITTDFRALSHTMDRHARIVFLLLLCFSGPRAICSGWYVVCYANKQQHCICCVPMLRD